MLSLLTATVFLTDYMDNAEIFLIVDKLFPFIESAATNLGSFDYDKYY